MDYKFNYKADEAIELLHKQGAFLTVKDSDKINTMTIGWGNIGYEWGKAIFMVMVRKSRYTHNMLENANEFTVSIPFDGSLKKELGFCGSKSGRDVDKISSCNLTLISSEKVSSPIVKVNGLVYECKVIYKHDLDISMLPESIKKSCYGDGDTHTLYYGEILKVSDLNNL